MGTFYFNGAADIAAELPPDWQTLGNWWMNSGHTVAATALPTSSDSVIATADILSNSGGPVTVVNITVGLLNEAGYNTRFLGIPISVTGTATFLPAACANENCTITGDCTFNESGYNGGTITGDCTFDNAPNIGTITGDCVFNRASRNGGTVTGDCTFNNGSYIDYGTVNGDCTFNGSSIENGTVNGNCTFNGGSLNKSGGTVNGDCVFTGESHNRGNVSGHATFNDTCENGDSGTPGFGGCGTATFNDNSSNYGSVGTVTFNDGSTHRSASSVSGHATFNDSSRTVDSPYNPILNTATFNDNSRCVGASVTDCTFNDNSRMEQGAYFSYISGTATFRDNSANINGCSGPVIVQHGGGINGSSILGII